ncbi:MAG: ABC transporter ATP-binding protein [Oscillospiraceae bacterium]|nr:ABC transporter ATP-binding protein [Oscillospiraceae bacterium]
MPINKNNDEDIVISVKNVTKKFKIYFDKSSNLKEKILFRNRNRYSERNVLNGISFDVKKGEAIGLIGQNGCGKSTMLKMLTRIMYPNSGTISVKGRISSIIELGAGFHPDMSGRENIYINASILGLSKKEIDGRIQEIIDFSELHEFIDNPVRTYSSGMYTRLAFSIAVNVDADILLIDEILAVGDASFQSKCFNKMMEIKAAGTTIVLVSHSLGDIEKVCNKAIWIKNGLIAMSGTPREVIPHYLDWIMAKDSEPQNALNAAENENIKAADHPEKNEAPNDQPPPENNNITGNGDIEIVDYQMINISTGDTVPRFNISDSVKIRMEYKRNNPQIKEAMASMIIFRNDGLICYTTNSLIDTKSYFDIYEHGVIEFTLGPIQLLQGNYTMDISLSEDYGPVYYQITKAFVFEVFNTSSDYGVFRPNCSWTEAEL